MADLQTVVVPTQVKTASYAASPGEFVLVDTTSGNITVTLPSAPPANAVTGAKMVTQGGAHTVTIVCSGSDSFNKPGGATTRSLLMAGESVILQYHSGIWAGYSGDTPVSGLDSRYIVPPPAKAHPSKFDPLLYGAAWGYAWKFYPDAYSCAGDGQFVTDGVMTTGGGGALACTSSALFKSGDVGKAAMVANAGGTYTGIRGPITAFSDSAHVTLGTVAAANTSGSPGCLVLWGSDDTARMQNCWNDADAYAAVHGEAEICYDPTAIYVVDQAFTVGGATLGNAQLFLPNVAQTGIHYQVFHNGGTEDSSPYPNWAQLVPQFSGGVIASTRVDGSHSASFGDSHVIGGPINGMGGESGASTGWSNFHLVVKGLTVITPYNSGAGCIDLFAIASQDIVSVSGFAAAVVPASSAPMPNMASASHIINQQGFGLRLAGPGNDASIRVRNARFQGLCYGLGISEWADVKSVHAMYCISGLEAYANGIGAVHLFEVSYAQVENCINALGMFDGGTVRGRIRHLGTESISAHFFDPSSQMHVDIGLAPQGSEGSYKSGGFMSGGTGGNNLGIYNIMTRPGPISGGGAPGVPATTVAWPNYYYVNLWVELSVSGGTLTALSVNGTAKTLPASCTSYGFMLPAGASYTPTYTGTLSHNLTAMNAA